MHVASFQPDMSQMSLCITDKSWDLDSSTSVIDRHKQSSAEQIPNTNDAEKHLLLLPTSTSQLFIHLQLPENSMDWCLVYICV